MLWPKNEAPLALLAGGGELPLAVAEAASAKGKKIVLIGVKGQADRSLERFADASHYIELGEAGSLPGLLKKHGVKRVVLAGSIPKRRMYDPSFKLDGASRELLGGAREKGDDKLLRAFELFLRIKAGVSVVDCREYLADSIATRGAMSHRAVTPDEKRDLALGLKVARAVGRLDIGQTVVVKQGVVLAVEALEGTDEAIRRGGALGMGGAVVVKTAKPNQNLRFDLPCVGTRTLETLASAQCRVLGVEAGKTLMIRKPALIKEAEKRGITLVGL